MIVLIFFGLLIFNVSLVSAAQVNTTQTANSFQSSPAINKLSNSTTTKLTPQEIVIAGSTASSYIEKNKKIPNTVNVANKSVNMAQLLHLMTTTTYQLSQGNNTRIALATDVQPLKKHESMNSGSLSQKEYLDLAQRITRYMDKYKYAPVYGITGLGDVGYQSQIYLFARLMASYQANKVLPGQIYMKAWDDSNIPISNTPIIFTRQQIISASVYTKNYTETNKKTPNLIKIGNEYINPAQLLHLMTTITMQLNAKNNTIITLQNDKLPFTSQENMKSGKVNKSTYLDFAKRIKDYMDIHHQAPSSGVIGLGTIGSQSQIYLYSEILTQYVTLKQLPNSVYLKPLNSIILMGTTSYGKVEKLGPFGNTNSPVHIAYIIGVHPLENNSHQAMWDAIKSYDTSLKYCYYIYKVTVTQDASNYAKGRMNGQLLANKFVVPDVIKGEYNFVIDVHSNVGNWAQIRFVFSPISGTVAETISRHIVKKLSWSHYYIPPNPTSTLYITVPLIKKGIPAIDYEVYGYDSYATIRNQQNQFVLTVDNMNF